jgi:iron complex transport system substrate-binding protein
VTAPRRLAGIALLALWLCALGSAPPGAAALTVTDPTGREVALPGPPRRIVSLVPSVTEILFAIEAQDRLVGVTDFCDWPPAARQKPRVGGMLAPSLEVTARLRPDLAIATTAGNREETVAQLERLHIPVYLVNPVRVDDALHLVERLGALTGRPEAAAALARSLRARLGAVQAAVATLGRPRVLYVLWPEPLIVPGRGALVSELIALAGGQSVTAAAPSDYPRYTIEAAVASAPDVIVLARHGAGQGAGDRDKWERFGHLPAVRARRLHAVDGGLLHRYGPRMVDGVELLARLIHPEAFGKAAAR